MGRLSTKWRTIALLGIAVVVMMGYVALQGFMSEVAQNGPGVAIRIIKDPPKPFWQNDAKP